MTPHMQGLLSEQPPRHTHQYMQNPFCNGWRVQMNSSGLATGAVRMLTITTLSPCSNNKE